jgi:hypothetical protein
VAGDKASLMDRALDRILDFAAESGLVVLLHSDIDMPFAKEDAEPVFLSQMKALLKRHPKTTIIWAHIGLGRVVHPVRASAEQAERSPRHVQIVEELLADPAFPNLHFDISWDEVAKYIVRTPDTVKAAASALRALSRPLRVRHGRGRPQRPTDLPARVRDVRPAVADAHAGDEREDPPGQLRTPVRRGPPQGAGLGAGERPMIGPEGRLT